jgi:UDP-N-acetylglucosamine--N-acetylmuramyl-(pentapeptide) pyrophosphoryl-undecaprenol N-acetylglucosamine transferase
LVSAGGTGGGVYPALAVVGALGKKVEVLWVGSESGIETTLVERAGYAFRPVPAAGVHGVGLRNLPGNLWQLIQGIQAARKVIDEYRPDVLFFTGGFVGIPIALAGWRLPKVIFVPDIEPALALRLIGRMADVITVITETSKAHYSSDRHVVVTGYPTRSELQVVTRDESRTSLNLSTERPVVLVFGGSRGARSINQALWGCLTNLLNEVQVVHITGELDWPQVEEVQNGLPQYLAGEYHPYAYLYDEMVLALTSADLVVSRAGAATLGEYTLLGLPAVLVPYPHAWRYQKVNADYLVSQGAAIQIDDEDLMNKLLPTVVGLIKDTDRLTNMASAMRQLAVEDATEAIADEILELATRKGVKRG